MGARPHVTIHFAQTLDGRLATCTRNSRWISGQESLRLAHRLRAEHQGIMVGIGTVLADDPRLTVRLVPGESPRRVVVDSTLRIPPGAAVLAPDPASAIVATTPRADPVRVPSIARAAEVVEIDADPDGHVDLEALLRHLRARGIETLLVEGGARLITALLRRRLVDRLIVCIAPKVLGAGVDAVGDLGISSLEDAITFSSATFTSLGHDVIFDGRL